VLIVDSVSDQQERWLKSNVTRMRRVEDPFTYEAVVVPSLEDALIAVLFNHNIQAIVVRPGLVLKSKLDNEILHSFLNRAGGSETIDAMQPDNCRKITDLNYAGLLRVLGRNWTPIWSPRGQWRT